MPKTLYSPKEKKAQRQKSVAGLKKTQARQMWARPVPIGVPSEDRRGEIVQVYSSSANMVCSAEIIHLPGDDDMTGAKKVPAGHFGVQYDGTHGCPYPAYKIVKESEMFSPCKGQKDGAKPGDCPATRPLCKQEVCAGLTVGKLDPHAQSKEERKRRETSGSNLKGARNRSARERRMREVVAAAPPAIKEEEEEVEEEEEDAVAAIMEEEEEEEEAAARVIFERAVERTLLGEELGVSRPDLGPAMFEERFEEMDRKKEDIIEQLLGGNLHIDALMYYDRPWGPKLFDDVWNKKVAAGIARRQADDAPDEPRAGGRPNRMRKTKKKKKKTKKKSKKKSKKKYKKRRR